MMSGEISHRSQYATDDQPATSRGLGNGRHSPTSPLKLFGQAKKKVNDIFVDIGHYIDETDSFLKGTTDANQNFKPHVRCAHVCRGIAFLTSLFICRVRWWQDYPSWEQKAGWKLHQQSDWNQRHVVQRSDESGILWQVCWDSVSEEFFDQQSVIRGSKKRDISSLTVNSHQTLPTRHSNLHLIFFSEHRMEKVLS